ncbi:TetR/AcrR family transcriptional regulator [Winogradskyella helgolandensis]|uniref:TetR/AcrR family transcriptional regulator n=1 Tax=Winogradskyella helgolandensis TaxID=2697010 RepID=UPI0015B839DD|nr:TetR/AcrR family transcriptional regulator [Winogradskyella helgolandensis]
MITKATLLKCSIEQFTQYGSKHVTLDDLARELGISKKTIYSFFKNKEDLVSSSVESIINEYKEDIDRIIISNANDPVLSVMLIYKRGFQYLQYFKPSFIFGIEKYYPKANKLYNDFIEALANSIVLDLLKKGKALGAIEKDINLELVVKLYFYRVDHLIFKENNLFESHSESELFKHLVTNNLRGIIAKDYSNSYFE